VRAANAAWETAPSERLPNRIVYAVEGLLMLLKLTGTSQTDTARAEDGHPETDGHWLMKVRVRGDCYSQTSGKPRSQTVGLLFSALSPQPGPTWAALHPTSVPERGLPPRVVRALRIKTTR